MSSDFINKLNKNKNDLTKSEMDLIKYIFENKNEVINYNISELADKSNLSMSTISRFSKKLGYSNFQRLKTDLNLTFFNEKDIIQSSKHNKDIDSYLNSCLNSSFNILENFLNRNGMKNIYSFVEMLQSSKQCLIFGTAQDTIFCEYLNNKLVDQENKIQYLSNFHYQTKRGSYLGNEDCAIIINYKSDARTLSKIFKTLTLNKVKTITITGESFSYISQNSDLLINLNLPLPAEDSEDQLFMDMIVFSYIDLMSFIYNKENSIF